MIPFYPTIIMISYDDIMIHPYNDQDEFLICVPFLYIPVDINQG